MNKEKIRVRIIHQIDPAGFVTGGIDSVILGIVKYSPPNIEFSIVGLTMDESKRPIGKWTLVEIGGKTINFFPVGRHNQPMKKGKLPLSLRLVMGIVRYRSVISKNCDRFEFHRIEPVIPLLNLPQPKHVFVHQNMQSLYNSNSDIGWKRFPQVFFAIESFVIPKFDRIFGVRQDAIDEYKSKFIKIQDRFSFIPTWFDPEIFFPLTPSARDAIAYEFIKKTFHCETKLDIVVSVGRLDSQKNPLLAVTAFAELKKTRPNVCMVMIGDGVLMPAVRALIHEFGLSERVYLAGLKRPKEIADILQLSDIYLMTSAYEGMPISVLEAAATGLPIVSTNVGEISRVVSTGINGIVVDRNDPEVIAEALSEVLQSSAVSKRESSLKMVSSYVPSVVLYPLYQFYINSNYDIAN